MFKTYMFIQHTATIHCMYTYTDILYAEDTVISNTNYTQQSKSVKSSGSVGQVAKPKHDHKEGVFPADWEHI